LKSGKALNVFPISITFCPSGESPFRFYAHYFYDLLR
jgi:hypothetical protein